MRKEPMKIGDLLKKYNLLVLLIVFIVIASILSPNFLTIGNVLNLLQPGINTGNRSHWYDPCNHHLRY